jgi:hypothetical protein
LAGSRILILALTLGCSASATLSSSTLADKKPISPLVLEGAVVALINMGHDAIAWNHEDVPRICVGAWLTLNMGDHLLPEDLPVAAFQRVAAALEGRARVYDVSSCTITRAWTAIMDGQPAWLVTYTDVDTEIDTDLAYRGEEIPRRKVRSAFEPNREAPPPYWQWHNVMTRPDHLLMWDGFGEIAYTMTPCGNRNFDFSGDEHGVKIKWVFDDPKIC